MTDRARRRRRCTLVAAALASAALALSGCAIDIGGIVEDNVSGFLEEQGIDAGISFGTGPSCLPDWVSFPSEEAANQGWSSPEGEVCVSSWPEISASVDVSQNLPEALDDGDLAEMFQVLVPMMTGQLPGMLGDQILGQAGQLEQSLALQDLNFASYGDNDRLLLVLYGGNDAGPDKMSLTMGVFCATPC